MTVDNREPQGEKELVGSLHELTKTVLARVENDGFDANEGITTRSGGISGEVIENRQVAVFDSAGKRIFYLVNLGKERDNRAISGSTENYPGGLYVYGVQLDEKGIPIDKLDSLMLPRKPIRQFRDSYLRHESSAKINSYTQGIKNGSVVDVMGYHIASGRVAGTIK